LKEYTKEIEEKIKELKAKKQKKTWEIQSLDIQIKDLVDKIGSNYILGSLASYQ